MAQWPPGHQTQEKSHGFNPEFMGRWIRNRSLTLKFLPFGRFQVPKARLSESKRRRTYAGGPDGYRPVGTAMEGYRGGIGAVSPPVTWDGNVGAWKLKMTVLSGESGDTRIYIYTIYFLCQYIFMYISIYILYTSILYNI